MSTSESAATPTAGDPDDAVYVFEAHSVRLPPVGSYLQELWDRRRFVTALARSEIQGKRSTMLAGQLWALLDPLFQAAIYWLLLSILRGGAGGRGTSAGLTLLIGGLFLFSFTRISLNDGARSVIGGRGLLLNSTFPRALLPITAVYKGLLELAPAGIVYAVIHVALGRPIGAGVIFLPLLLMLHTALNLGLALLFAALTVFMRDITNLLGYLLRVLLFITPVLYPATTLLQLAPALKVVFFFNPLFPIFSAYQQVMLGGVPTIGQVAAASAWAALFLSAGGALFVSHERAFALHV